MLLVLSCDPVGSMDSMGPVVLVGPVDLVDPLGAKGSMVAVGAALLWCDSWMVLWSVSRGFCEIKSKTNPTRQHCII